MNVRKRILSVIAAAAMLGSACFSAGVPLGTFTAPAAISASAEGEFTCDVTETGVTITSYSGSATSLEIPDTLDGKPVVAIGSRVFRDHTELESVVIPKGVTSIGLQAFYGCSNLSSVTLPEGLRTIVRKAFYNCTSLIEITIPKSVDDINDDQSLGYSDNGAIPGFTIYGKAGTAAETYANTNGFTFIDTGNSREKGTLSIRDTYPTVYCLGNEIPLPDDTQIETTNVGAERTCTWYRGRSTDGMSEQIESPDAAGDYTLLVQVAETDAYTAAEALVDVHVQEHQFVEGICQVCGGYEDGIGARLAGNSLSLNGNIGVNFYMELDDGVLADSGAYLLFTYANGTTKKVLVQEARVDTQTAAGKTYYVFPCEVAAKEMTDTILAQMHLSDGRTGKRYAYTVKQYADYLLEHTEEQPAYEKAAPLVRAMLNYGAYAQLNFQHSQTTLANANFSESEKSVEQVTAQTLEAYRNQTVQQSDFVKLEGASLSLDSQTTLRLYFSCQGDAAIEDLRFFWGEQALTPQKSGNFYCVELSDIAAKNLGTAYTVRVTCGEASLDVQYSAMAYGYHVLQRDVSATRTQALKDTIAAMYLYYQAAKDYFA